MYSKYGGQLYRCFHKWNKIGIWFIPAINDAGDVWGNWAGEGDPGTGGGAAPLSDDAGDALDTGGKPAAPPGVDKPGNPGGG